MKRKTIQLAGSTLVVSLPSKWVKKFNIAKGDELELEEADKNLIIKTEGDLVKQKKFVDVSNTAPMTKRIPGALYKAGYDEFDIKFSSPEELGNIQSVIRETCVGFEVAEQGKNIVKIKEISKIDESEFDTILRRVFLVIKSIANDSAEAMTKSDFKWLKMLTLRDKDVNKLDDFCRRILNKKGYKDYSKTSALYFIVEELEKIGDVYRDICKYVAENELNTHKKVIKAYSRVNELFDMFYKLFYDFSIKSISEFGKEFKNIKKDLILLLDKMPRKETIIIFNCINLAERIFDMNGCLMTIKL